MDIAKYIGLFLLKNNFCYLHGLGNLELRKKPASYDGDALHAPEYDVVLTPGGSIDDTLANYIAVHEQTSISKAANTLREFSTATRAELAAGKEVEIPAIGKFVEEGGVIRFVANPHLKHVPPPVPVLRMSKRLEEAPDFRRDAGDSNSGSDGSSFSGGKIGLIVLILAVIVGAVVLGIRFFNSGDATTAATTDTVVTAPVTAPAPVTVAPQPVDSVIAPPPTMASVSGYTVVINTYQTATPPTRRAAKLTNNGNQVAVVSRDSSNHLVTVQVDALPADTMRVLDSLRRFFNPKGVYILR
jgi:nucleoid DNA-binding protein